MWVAPSIRGLGIAQRQLESLEKHASAVGVDVLQMDTHRTLAEVQKLFPNAVRKIRTTEHAEGRAMRWVSLARVAVLPLLFLNPQIHPARGAYRVPVPFAQHFDAQRG